MNLSVIEPSDQSAAVVVELKCCDEIGRQMPVCHIACINAP